MTAQHRPERGQPQVDLMSKHQQNVERLGVLMAEGIASGELRSDLDVMEGVMTLLGALHIRCMAYLYGQPLPEAERVLALFFNGAATR